MADLTYFYPQRREAALKGVNLAIGEGELVLVIGESGSGKSTLLRAMSGIIPEFYGGNYLGEVYIDGQKLRGMKNRERARKIGFLFQNPENQLFTFRVEKELVFALENLKFPRDLMQKKIAETAGFFGLSSSLNGQVAQLSGGMKQKLALASLVALKPEILILDEPLSQLDPQAAEEILNLVLKLNEEYNITVVMAEQRLEKCLPLADRIVVMEEGKIVGDRPGREGLSQVFQDKRQHLLPSLPRLFARWGEEELPFTVKEARSRLDRYGWGKEAYKIECKGEVKQEDQEVLFALKGLWFSYPEGEEVLKNVDFKIQKGDIWAVMGENVAGKTTLLKIMAGILKPGKGKVFWKERDLKTMRREEIARKISLVPQNPDDYFFLPTLEEEVSFNLKQAGRREEEKDEILKEFGLLSYAGYNPRDLSMGEKQRLLLAAILALDPDIILLDEPTRGLDYPGKEKLGEWIKNWSRQGKAVVMVSHDVEFAAEYGDKVLLLFNGQIAAMGSKYEVMDGALFYSPPVNRLFAGKVEKVLTLDEGYQILKKGKEGREKKSIMDEEVNLA